MFQIICPIFLFVARELQARIFVHQLQKLVRVWLIYISHFKLLPVGYKCTLESDNGSFI